MRPRLTARLVTTPESHLARTGSIVVDAEVDGFHVATYILCSPVMTVEELARLFTDMQTVPTEEKNRW